jgi:4-hydroxyacetophenone monooxygenase
MKIERNLVEGPVTESDAFLEQVLGSTNAVALLLATVCLTNDPQLLDRIPIGEMSFGQIDNAISKSGVDEVRAAALQALRDYRDAGSPPPPALSDALVTRIVKRVIGPDKYEDYREMMLEEIMLGQPDMRALQWTSTEPPAAAKTFHTLVIGAGLGGMTAAIRLQEAGLPYIVIEKNDAVGGTWYENSYPGCRVDVINHFYSYSFDPNHDWSEQFSQRNELHRYFERCADKFGIRENIRFGTEVVAAEWREETANWVLTLRLPSGVEETVQANAIISAVGQLNRPSIPEIAGQEDFKGPSFHTARWRHDIDLTGKRVVVIGTGASAFQMVPEVAKIAGRLTVMQRAAHWMFPNPIYHDNVPEGKKWVLKHFPFYASWYRFLLFWTSSDGLLPLITQDPDWPHPERSVNAANDAQREAFTAAIAMQLEGRPDLLEKVVPKYPPFVKRILQDNGQWLGALKRDNVALVTTAIDRITETGVRCADGTEYPADVIVYATGFHASKFLWPMRITGRGGKVLNEVWGDEPHAYLGITVADFPNLFCIYGPNTNLAHGGSLIFHSECQVRYILNGIKYLVENGYRAMDVKPEQQRDYVERLQAAANKMVWAYSGVQSWYKNDRNVVITVSPWRLIDYWRWTREPDKEDYEFLGR